jgi:acyl dehydratase
MPKLYWKDIEIGDPIPPLTRAALTRSEMVAFAVVAQESSQLHLDEEFARQAGYGSISAPGLLGMALAGQTVEQWLDNGRVIGITTRFQKLIWPGDVLTAKGVIVRKYEASGQHRVDCDVWVQNQANDIVLKGTATCHLFFDAADERKKHGKHPDANLSIPPMPKPVAPPPSAPRPEIVAAGATARPHVASAAKNAGKAQPQPAARPAPLAGKPVARPAPVAAKPVKPVAAVAKKPAPVKAAAPAKKATAKPAPAKKPAAKPAKKPVDKKPAAKKEPAKPAKKPAAKGKSKK